MDYSNIGIGQDTVFNIDECPDCRFVFANPRIKVENQELPYNESKQNQWSDVDEETGQSEDKVTLRKRRLGYLPILLRLIALNGSDSNLRLLDVGAGYGHTLSLARELVIDVYGIEIDRSRLEYCRQSNLEVYAPDEFDAKFPDLKFDIIVTQSILEHAVDLDGFMASVASRAEQGAVLFTNGLTPEVIRIERKRNLFVRAHFIEHLNYIPVPTLDLFLKRHGFYPIKKHILLLNGKTFLVPDFLVGIWRTAREVKDTGFFSRYYRFGGEEK